MKGSRIRWAALILAAGILYLFDNGTITLAILLVSMAAPLLSLLPLELDRSAVSLSLQTDSQAHTSASTTKAGSTRAAATDADSISIDSARVAFAGTDVTGETSMGAASNGVANGSEDSASIDPARAASAPTGTPVQIRACLQGGSAAAWGALELDCTLRNCRTGREASVTRQVHLLGRRECVITENAILEHAGVYEIQVQTRHQWDILHLVKRREHQRAATRFIVLPEGFPMHISLLGSSAALLESDRYARNRGGNDPGEVRSIREYMPGDPVRNIHWKLSEKMQVPLVKELGLPVSDQILVLMDLTAGEHLPERSLDAIAAVSCSLMRNLLQAEMSFTAGWMAASGRMQLCKVTEPAGLDHVLEAVLSLPVSGAAPLDWSGLDRLDGRFAHLLVVGAETPYGVETVAGGAQVSLLTLDSGQEGVIVSGAQRLSFTERDFAWELSDIAI